MTRYGLWKINNNNNNKKLRRLINLSCLREKKNKNEIIFISVDDFFCYLIRHIFVYFNKIKLKAKKKIFLLYLFQNNFQCIREKKNCINS